MSTWSPDPTWHNRVTQSALRSGVNPEVLIGLARAESGLRNIPTGIAGPGGAPASSAFGPWQFTAPTWDGVVRNNPGAGLTPEGRLDPNMQAEAAPLLASEIISGLGVEDPTATDLYMGWAYGPRGQAMARAARSNPDAPASEFVDPQWITQHGFAADATVGEVFDGTGRALADRAGIDPRAPATAKDGMEKMTTAAGMPPMATRDVGRPPGVLAPGEPPPALPGLLSDGPAPSAPGAPRAESGGLLDGLLGLLGGGEDPGRDDVFGGLLGNGESNLPMLMVGLQILQNAGPSLEPQSMFAGVQEAAAGGMRMQQFQDQRRGQADRQAMLERLTAADPALAALARLDPEGVSRALVERGFATADGGEIREVGGRLVRVMRDGTVQELYAAPDAGQPDAPAGYRYVTGPDGVPTLEPIPGGPADPAGFADTADRAERLRDDFRTEVADYEQSVEKIGQLISNLERASAAGDLAAVINFMKVLDPSSVVSAGEQATAQNAAGVPQRIRSFYNNLLAGEVMTPEQRRDFAQTALDALQPYRSRAEAITGRYRDFASEFRVPEGQVIFDLTPIPALPPALLPPGTNTGTAGAAPTAAPAAPPAGTSPAASAGAAVGSAVRGGGASRGAAAPPPPGFIEDN